MSSIERGEEHIPLRETNRSTEYLTMEYCNEHTRIQKNTAQDSTTFYFDYSSDIDGVEVINGTVLRQLKTSNKWGVIRHPFVLNYLNQKLLKCATVYSIHIFGEPVLLPAFFSFLLLLSWQIFAPTTYKNALVLAFVGIFQFCLIYKLTLRTRVGPSVSVWFVIANAFSLLTNAITAAYILLPIVFKYDDYHEEIKKIIIWLLPVIAIIAAWMNFLYILRKSPFGIYIFMMTRILKSFGHIATIWIPTLIAFSFAFHLIMKDTDIQPWSTLDRDTANMTMVSKMFVILQAITKTSTMMIGEVDANDILNANQWIPSILVLAFEIITVILLMNLMVSLAVGDVTDLRHTAQDKLLKIKVNFIVEALQIAEQFEQTSFNTAPTENSLTIFEDGSYSTKFVEFPRNQNTVDIPETFRVNFIEAGLRLRIKTVKGTMKVAVPQNCYIDCKELMDTGIPVLPPVVDDMYPTNTDGYLERYKKWLLGLDWEGYMDI